MRFGAWMPLLPSKIFSRLHMDILYAVFIHPYLTFIFLNIQKQRARQPGVVAGQCTIL